MVYRPSFNQVSGLEFTSYPSVPVYYLGLLANSLPANDVLADNLPADDLLANSLSLLADGLPANNLRVDDLLG